MKYHSRNPHKKRHIVSRRRFIGQLACSLLAMGVSACAPGATEPGAQENSRPQGANASASYSLPTAGGAWAPLAPHTGDLPAGTGSVVLDDIGTFGFATDEVVTVRPDIFKGDHFSLFDALVHLDKENQIDLAYHWDEAVDTHVIDTINGREGWWYNAYYANGWREDNVFRMDAYPYKNETQINVVSTRQERLAAIHRTFREEVDRLASNDGQVVIPDVTIHSPVGKWSFQDVEVRAHDVRSDLFQPGVVTALDAIISLAEQKKLSDLQLTWYERIAGADPVDSYWVSRINDAVASGGCGFVYETGPSAFDGFRGSHIHIPADARAIVSPEYALWFWICL